MRLCLAAWLALAATAAAAEPEDDVRPAAAAPFQYAPSSGRLAALGANPAFEASPSQALVNPASLGRLKGTALALDYQSQPGEIRRQALAGAFPLADGAMALSLDTVDYGSFELTDEDGNSQGTGALRDFSASLAWGRSLGRLALGAQAAARREDLAGDALWMGFAGAGFMAQGPWGLQAGLSWLMPLQSELGPGLGRLGLSQPLWGAAELGLSGSLMPGVEQDLLLSFSFSPLKGAQLRASQRWNVPDPQLGSLGGASLGAGLAMQGWELDYAFVPVGELGQAHHISLGYSFGSAQEPKPKPAAAAPAAEMPASAPAPLPPAASKPKEFLQLKIVSQDVTRGLEWERQGQWSKAFSAYRAAVAKNERDVSAWKAMAAAYEKLGRQDYAKQCYQKLAELDPGDLEARQWLIKRAATASAKP